ncbi:sulfur carrier protein ThiS [Falsihalocynthiibacter sp. SS001]|uniref:sulfur carrier protein ThiS n=1 Tax=Falsihalocynthiibacter sp. SS001 TaxID=3349698 RepID=UPI0036D28DE2
MRIFVNGEAADVKATTLHEVLGELGYVGDAVATALNEEFVAATARETQPISNNDRLEIVAPMQGG